ncbi:MAG: hypothetical protein ACREUW_10750 [Burkholderiales bacterium]
MIRTHPGPILFCLLLLLGACSRGPEVPEWQLIATDPPAEARLGRQQPFYVQFEVRSRAPVKVALMPRYRGEDAVEGLATQAEITLPAGGGRAVASFFYWGQIPTRVDELRFTVSAPGQPSRQFSAPVNLTWRADPQPAPTPAAWVVEWRKTQPPPPADNPPSK